VAGNPGGDADAGNHHDPDNGGRGGAARWRHSLGQHGKQGCARRAHRQALGEKLSGEYLVHREPRLGSQAQFCKNSSVRKLGHQIGSCKKAALPRLALAHQ